MEVFVFMYNTTEVIENLTLLDEYAGQMGYSRKDLFIIGGAAMMLRGCINKFSSDVDIINEDLTEHEISFLNSFATNNEAAEVVKLPNGFETRLKAMNFGGNTYTFKVASLEDIIATKIGRFDMSDMLDMRETDILERIDVELLNEICGDLASKDSAYASNWGRFKAMFFQI